MRFSAEQAIRLGNRLTFGDGPCTGQTVTLRAWQEDIIRKLSAPEIEVGALWLPKKNSKTMLAAIFILAELVHGVAHNLSPEIYSGSGTGKDQAALVFRAVAGFIEQTPALSEHFWVRENIYKVQSRDKHRPGFYKCVVADADKLDGPNPSLFVMDEIHRGGKKTQDIWDTMRNGMAQRPNPLALSISTAGPYIPESAAYRLYDYSKKVRDGVLGDDTFCSIIYEHDGPVPWDEGEEAMWSAYRACNPGAGDFIREKFIRGLIRKALDLPSRRPNFERFFLNIWTNEAETFMSPKVWEANQVLFDEAELEGRPCFVGGDLAWAEDMSAVVLVFPMDDGTVRLLPRFWVPGDSLAERQKKAGAPLDAWYEAGHLRIFPGGVTDFDMVFDSIENDAERFDIQGIAHDPVGTADIWKQCSDELGLDVMKFSPKPWSMNDPIRSFEAAVIEGRVQHNNHPVLAWNVANAMSKEDSEERIILVKRTRSQNIDGLIGAILGHAVMKSGIETRRKKKRKCSETEAYAV